MALLLKRGELKTSAEYGDAYKHEEISTLESTPLLHSSKSNEGNTHLQGGLLGGCRSKYDMIKRRRVAVCLILAEMFARVTYYGIVLNFVLFLRVTLSWTPAWSVGGALVFSGTSWFMTVIFGLVADSRFGKKNIISIGYLVYTIGAVCLPVIVSWVWHKYLFAEKCTKSECPEYSASSVPVSPWLVVIMMAIAIGEGALKANLSSFSSEQFKDKPTFIKARAFFNCFYWSTNVLALVLLFGMVYVQQMNGFVWGFICPAVSLGLSFLCFIISRHDYTVTPPVGTGLSNVWLILKESFTLRRTQGSQYTSIHSSGVESDALDISPDHSWLDKAAVSSGGRFPDREVEGVRRLCHILMVFTGLIPYWMINAQMQTTFIIQGLHMQFQLESGGGFIIPAAWLCLYEVFLLIVIIPLFDKAVYPCLEFLGCSFSKVWRIPLGMFFATLAMVAAGLIDYQKTYLMQDNGILNQTVDSETAAFVGVKEQYIMWQIPQFTLMGISEVFASISGLDFAYSYCPSGMNQLHSSISAFFHLTISLGHFLGIAGIATASALGFYISAFDGDNYLSNDKIMYYFFGLAGLSCLNIIFFSLFLCGYGMGQQRKEHNLLINEEEVVQQDEHRL